jgi:hypothetical protein
MRGDDRRTRKIGRLLCAREKRPARFCLGLRQPVE